jgi:hypothetical protein
MQYELTGGGIVLTADTATFELIRTAAMQYYLNFPIEFGQINQDVTTDRTKTNIVQITFKVSSDSSRDYTINKYTSSSRFLINGKNTQIFVDRDLKNIHKIIESATQTNTEAHLKNLSVKMTEQLTKLLQARLVDNSTRPQETDELSNPPISSSSSINCIKCKKKYKTKSTYCTEGRHWVHYNCEKLSNKEIENVEQGQNSEYTCTICRNNKAKTSMIAIELPKK